MLVLSLKLSENPEKKKKDALQENSGNIHYVDSQKGLLRVFLRTVQKNNCAK